jgi:hypothetical protein
MGLRTTSYVGCTATEMMDNLNIQVYLCTKEGRLKTRTGYGFDRPATMYEERLYKQKLIQELEASLNEEVPA